jgi:hypothetical protein
MKRFLHFAGIVGGIAGIVVSVTTGVGPVLGLSAGVVKGIVVGTSMVSLVVSDLRKVFGPAELKESKGPAHDEPVR